MQVFNCLMKIIKKNLPSVSIYFFIFLILTLIFTNTAKDNTVSDFTGTRLSITVINRDNSILGNALKEYLGARHTLVELPDEKERLQDELFYRNTEYILVIPEGFEQAMLRSAVSAKVENIKVPNSTTGAYIDLQVEQYIRSIAVYRQSGYSIEEAVRSAKRDMDMQADVEMISKSNGETKSIFFYFQFLPYIFLAVLISALGPVLLVFNNKDIRRRNESSAMKLRNMNAQLIFGCVLFALLCWIAFTIIPIFLYREDLFTTGGIFLLLNSLASVIAALSIAYLAGILTKGTNALSAISNTVGLGMCFLGGVFVPQAALNENILFFSRLLPTYWYVRAVDTLNGLHIFDSESLQPVFEGILIQLGFAVAVFAVALVISRQKKMNPAS